MRSILADFQHFLRFFLKYGRLKIVVLAKRFEKLKNWFVDLLMFKRGVLQKKVWHSSMIGLSIFAVFTSGLFGGETIVSSSFPGVGGNNPRFLDSFNPNSDDPVLNSLFDTRTTISQKVRSEIIEYEVQSGDTASIIADKFSISTETLKWSNKLENINSIKPGQKLKILPVSGVAHEVKSGDTIENVAKKYTASSQAILDFPFNDISDDLKLKIGQVLIVPDGVAPQAPAPTRRPAPVYLAEGKNSPAFSAPGGGVFIWPTRGVLTQYFAWYHPALDIANNASPAITASDAGVVTVAGWPDSWGYGNRVVLDHGNGYQTLYAHLSNVYVSAGQRVSRGQSLGQMGTTGRSTGIHLHFEIKYKGIALNPLAILK